MYIFMEYDLYIKKNMTYYYIFWSIHSRHQFLASRLQHSFSSSVSSFPTIEQILHVKNSEAGQTSS